MPPKVPAQKKPAAKPAARAAAKPAAAKSTGKKQPAAASASGGKKEEAKPDILPEVKVTLKELDAVVLKDTGDKIKNSGKWPLIIDTIGQATTFIRYRDCNYIEALNQSQMEPEKLRLAVLGSLKYGKPLVLDMLDLDMFEAATTSFNSVMPELMEHIMDKSIMEEKVYEKLIQEGDENKEYDYAPDNTSKFQFWIISQNPSPSDALLAKTYPIRMT